MTTKKKAKGGRTLDAGEQARYRELASWAETADIGPDAVITKAEGPGAGQALLESVLGSKEAVTRAVGKPSLSTTGVSPSRTLRLPREMDAQLVARAAAEHRKPSAIMRDALAEYLTKA
jgi:hypothetical protein